MVLGCPEAGGLGVADAVWEFVLFPGQFENRPSSPERRGTTAHATEQVSDREWIEQRFDALERKLGQLAAASRDGSR
jgi:hypothetical protein